MHLSQLSSPLLWFAVGDLEVEGQPSDEHVALEPDLVDRGRRQRDGEADEAHHALRTAPAAAPALLPVGRVLRPQLAQHEHDLEKEKKNVRFINHAT